MTNYICTRQLIQIINNAVNDKSFKYEENQTTVDGFMKHKNGNHFFVNGYASIELIGLLSSTEIEVSISYSGHYLRKKYIGVFNDYRNESLNVRGEHRGKINITPFGITYKKVGAFNIGEIGDSNHDSNVMTVRGFEKCIIFELKNALNSYNCENIQNEMLEIYKKVINTRNELRSNHPSTAFTFNIKAGVVQIIESSDGIIIGELSL